MTIINGDCLDILKTYPNNHFTSIITDPPYGLSFMGKKWDYEVPSIEIWKECLRVLKPGGTALIFAGSRTQHRMACNVEDAGFILKDCLMWLYGSGFPKATDISKQLDKMAGVERERGEKKKDFNKYNSINYKKENAVEYVGRRPKEEIGYEMLPSTPEAKQWNGYKSHGLKPAYEPILLAMKPNEGSYAQNALKWGVSGLNIDAGRIEGKPRTTHSDGNYKGDGNDLYESGLKTGYHSEGATGRFPANILLDSESAAILDEQTGVSKSSDTKNLIQDDRSNDISYAYKKKYKRCGGYTDKGGASRFFYTAKASKSERNAGCENNSHPTVKSLALMKYLIKLVMPPKDGLLLDPFAGSGSTIVAATSLDYDSIGIELEEEYCEMAHKRVSYERSKPKQMKMDL